MKPRWQDAMVLASLASAFALLACGGRMAYEWKRAHEDSRTYPAVSAAFPRAMPERVLWAWEEPEDLRAVPETVGVAYLAETLVVGDDIRVLPRRQPLEPAPGAMVMPVVRMEVRRGFVDTPALRRAVAAKLSALVRERPARALQIDFDATVSQRDFYAGVLQILRPELPSGLPLSITALVSWCGRGSWLRGLPIDEAVPMFFRMGGPRSLHGNVTEPERLAEPLCRGSIGVSTDEPWPSAERKIRVYVFAPRPWRDREVAFATAPLPRVDQEFPR